MLRAPGPISTVSRTSTLLSLRVFAARGPAPLSGVAPGFCTISVDFIRSPMMVTMVNSGVREKVFDILLLSFLFPVDGTAILISITRGF